MTLPPCLRLVGIAVSGHVVSADLQIGPRIEQLVIDLSIPGFAAVTKMPSPLNASWQVQRTLFEILERAHRGEVLNLPLDLSSATWNVSEAWPLQPKPDAYVSDERFDVQVLKAEHDAPEHGMTTVQLRVRGIATVAILDNQDAERKSTLFRFISGVHPWQLTDAEAWAMFLALAKASAR